MSYLPTSVVLSTTSLLAGDINSDGTVNRADAAQFARHFGLTTGATWATGDFNSDGRTTLSDLLILHRNLGQSTPAGSPGSAAAIPEPSAAALALMALVGFVLRLRRSN